MDALKKIGAIALTVGVMDAGWLTFQHKYHQSLFKAVQGSPLTVRWGPALLIYALIPTAIYLYAEGKTMEDAVTKGALLGLVLYAFYDLTNYATLEGWTLQMTITDILWGVLVCSAGAAVGHLFH